METAKFKNKLVTVAEFKRTSEQGDFATCPACLAKMTPYAVSSVNLVADFRHPVDKTKDKCVLSYDRPTLDGYLRNAEREKLGAEQLRSEFFVEEHLRKSFAFLCNVTGYGSMNMGIFRLLCSKTDTLDLWSLKNLKPWMIPFLMLTLMDFDADRGKPYRFRFVLEKPKKTGRLDKRVTPAECSVRKHFVDRSGKTGRSFADQYPNHWMQLSPDTFVERSNDNWLPKGWLAEIRYVSKNSSGSMNNIISLNEQ